ncbi:hypothetical protein J3Q64DRAFT_1073005 [Phycomyces blakesleeanus]|uniref:Uncharacterized protein n=1 Tax=Phycomyces blakesleeanus TaxID=4837 RepID=A0ABR3BH98_PHYBL
MKNSFHINYFFLSFSLSLFIMIVICSNKKNLLNKKLSNHYRLTRSLDLCSTTLKVETSLGTPMCNPILSCCWLQQLKLSLAMTRHWPRKTGAAPGESFTAIFSIFLENETKTAITMWANPNENGTTTPCQIPKILMTLGSVSVPRRGHGRQTMPGKMNFMKRKILDPQIAATHFLGNTSPW